MSSVQSARGTAHRSARGGLFELAPGLVTCLDAADDFTHRITSQLKFQLSVNESIVCLKNYKQTSGNLN